MVYSQGPRYPDGPNTLLIIRCPGYFINRCVQISILHTTATVECSMFKREQLTGGWVGNLKLVQEKI